MQALEASPVMVFTRAACVDRRLREAVSESLTGASPPWREEEEIASRADEAGPRTSMAAML